MQTGCWLGDIVDPIVKIVTVVWDETADETASGADQ
jgi:hypothetical protein